MKAKKEQPVIVVYAYNDDNFEVRHRTFRVTSLRKEAITKAMNKVMEWVEGKADNYSFFDIYGSKGTDIRITDYQPSRLWNF